MFSQFPVALARARRGKNLDTLVQAEEGFTEEVSEDCDAHCDRGETACFAAAKVAQHGGCFVDGACDEFGIGAVRGVPVASVEYADGFIIIGCREAAVEANEADFVVDLYRFSV